MKRNHAPAYAAFGALAYGVLASVSFFAASCSGASSRTHPDSVHVEGTSFRDGRGRQLLFRGINVKFPGLFDVSFDDGRRPNYVYTDFTDADMAHFETLGFDVVRLPVNWSALEPHPHAYSAAFFDALDRFLQMAWRHHLWVIVDMHQDAYSKEIGEDGAPLWAIVPPPAMVLQGPSDNNRRFSNDVLAAGLSFFDNQLATDGRPLQQAFIAAASEMVKRHLGDPAVLGWEAFNEPVLFSLEPLDAFHARFADGVHALDRDAPILFEPVVFRNQTDMAALPLAPWRHGPGVYAPHIYTGWFSLPSQNGWSSQDPAKLAPSMMAAQTEAAAWGTPLLVTEFGCDQTVARGPVWLDEELKLQDALLASSTMWTRECEPWGLCGDSATHGDRPATAKVVSRMYPRAVAGDLVAIERPAPGQMIVRYRATARTHGLAHEVSVSPVYVRDVQATCDGAPVTIDLEGARAIFTCPAGAGDHQFMVGGALVP